MPKTVRLSSRRLGSKQVLKLNHPALLITRVDGLRGPDVCKRVGKWLRAPPVYSALAADNARLRCPTTLGWLDFNRPSL